MNNTMNENENPIWKLCYWTFSQHIQKLKLHIQKLHLRASRKDVNVTKKSDGEYNIMPDNLPWTKFLHKFVPDETL